MSELWIARDSDGDYSLHESKPRKSCSVWCSADRINLNPSERRLLFGHGLAPGTCARITGKLSIEMPEPEPQACPVCGAPAQIVERSMVKLDKRYYVACTRRPEAHPCLYGPERDTRIDAITAWNRLSYSKEPTRD